MEKLISSQRFLKSALERHLCQSHNKSLRSFAYELGIDAGRVSQYLNGKRRITVNAAEKISMHLDFSEQEKKEFLTAVREENKKHKESKRAHRELTKKSLSESSYHELSEEQFELISSWYYFPLLSLFDCELEAYTPEVFAKELGIGPYQMEKAFSQLKELGLLKVDHQGSWGPTQKSLKTSQDVSSRSLKSSHKETIIQSLSYLNSENLEERDFSSMTMAIDPLKIPLAKQMIKEFRRGLCAFLENGRGQEVYNLNIQLVPAKNRPIQ